MPVLDTGQTFTIYANFIVITAAWIRLDVNEQEAKKYNCAGKLKCDENAKQTLKPHQNHLQPFSRTTWVSQH